MMDKLRTVFLLAVVLACTSLALADSSGNFVATGTSATCVATPATFNSSTGDFTGATLSGGTTIGNFMATIQVPGGLGTSLLIRPSLDTGLFTETKLTTTINNATADVGIMVCVNVQAVDKSGNPVGAPATVDPTPCVVYDQRIQQVSNTLFANLATCVSTLTATTCGPGLAACPAGDTCTGLPPSCTADANCPTGDTCALTCTSSAQCAPGATCTIPAGAASGTCSAGLCTGPNDFCVAPAAGCNFEILLTTLAAHSFDFVAPDLPNGNYRVSMTWGEIGTNNNTVNGTTQSCVGPVDFTVVQVKNFHNDSDIVFDTL